MKQAHVETTAPAKYAVKNIFCTIQGEGKFSGTPSLFIRFAGCNLDCSFCDTDWRRGTSMSFEVLQDNILDCAYAHMRTHGHAPRHCVLTGGEPALQVSRELCQWLKAVQFTFGAVGAPEGIQTIAIETNGTRALHKESLLLDCITCSPKLSQGPEAFLQLQECDELKCVIGPLDTLPTLPQKLVDSAGEFLFVSPMTFPERTGADAFDEGAIRNCVNIVQSTPGWRISLQTHKLLGVE